MRAARINVYHIYLLLVNNNAVFGEYPTGNLAGFELVRRLVALLVNIYILTLPLTLKLWIYEPFSINADQKPAPVLLQDLFSL